MQREREAEVQAQQAVRGAEPASRAGGAAGKGWNEEDLQLLIKAVNLFPAGTNARLVEPAPWLVEPAPWLAEPVPCWNRHQVSYQG